MPNYALGAHGSTNRHSEMPVSLFLGEIILPPPPRALLHSKDSQVEPRERLAFAECGGISSSGLVVDGTHQASIEHRFGLGTQPTKARTRVARLFRERTTSMPPPGGCTQGMHGRSRITIDPCIPIMLGWSTSGFHRPGRPCLHQARSTVHREVLGESRKG